MTCTKCGNLLAADTKFCNVCGKDLQESAAQPQDPQASAPAAPQGISGFATDPQKRKLLIIGGAALAAIIAIVVIVIALRGGGGNIRGTWVSHDDWNGWHEVIEFNRDGTGIVFEEHRDGGVPGGLDSFAWRTERGADGRDWLILELEMWGEVLRELYSISGNTLWIGGESYRRR